jgi:hypothetical protein
VAVVALQAWIHDMACAMLSLEELPLDLRNYLDEIEMYANLAGGSIQSRQVVAIALVNYMDRKAFLNKIGDMEEMLHIDDE